jgi:hypothetical protein
MKIRRMLTVGGAVVVLGFAGHTTLVGQQAPQQITVALSDPGRPAKIELNLINGGVTIKGVNRKDVLIDARPREEGPGRSGRVGRSGRAGDPGASAGLRRLAQTPGFDVEEARNEVKIDAGAPGSPLDFEIQVPLRTNLELSLVNNAILTVSDVEGELELENVNGPITLTNIAGSVVAHTVNGKVTATMTRIAADKPMAFTSLNGNVDVTLPASVKATFKLRSDRGDVFTDFDMQTRPNAAPQEVRREGGKLRIEVNNAIYGNVNGGGPEFEMRTFNGTIYVRKGK